MIKSDKIKGAIYGLAFGDAWGWPEEFKTWETIESEGFKSFPRLAIITDDTQMSLYALKAIHQNYDLFNQPEVDETKTRLAFGESFISWLSDPDNDRAPGITCLTSLQKLDSSPKISGLEGTNFNSKGCGANMRNPWFGLLPLSRKNIEILSVIQASTTHYHPLALAASAVTALVTKDLYDETVNFNSSSLFDHTRTIVETLIHENDHSTFDPQYLEGLYELRDFLASYNDVFFEFIEEDLPEVYDICKIFGEGKVAEEALLLAIVSVDKHDTNSEEGLKYLAHSSGDSDSIAAIAGAFFGAKNGYQSFNPEWVNYLETRYQNELGNTYVWLDSLTD